MLSSLAAGAALVSGHVALDRGTYVLAGTPCKDAPFAAMRSFDGANFSGPHDARCTTRILGRHANAVRIATTCRANGDGSPTVATTQTETIRLVGRRSFTTAAVASGTPVSYRLCPAA